MMACCIERKLPTLPTGTKVRAFYAKKGRTYEDVADSMAGIERSDIHGEISDFGRRLSCPEIQGGDSNEIRTSDDAVRQRKAG